MRSFCYIYFYDSGSRYGVYEVSYSGFLFNRAYLQVDVRPLGHRGLGNACYSRKKGFSVEEIVATGYVTSRECFPVLKVTQVQY